MTDQQKAEAVFGSAYSRVERDGTTVSIEGVLGSTFDVVKMCALWAPLEMEIEDDSWGCPTCGDGVSIVLNLKGCRL